MTRFVATSMPTRRNFWAVVVISIVLGVLVSLVLPKKYTAESVILVDRSNDASELLSSNFSDLLPTGLGLGFQAQGNGYAYEQIVRSRAILGDILELRVQPSSARTYFAYFAPRKGSLQERRQVALAKLRKSIGAKYDNKSGTFTLQVSDADPLIASNVANTLVESLRRFNAKMRSTRARDAASFVEERLTESQAALAVSEERLAAFLEANARIGHAPGLQLRRQRLERDVQIGQEIYALLARQHEQAQIQEKRETPVFTVLDVAEPPANGDGFPLPLAGLASGVASIALMGLLHVGATLRLQQDLG